ncbi:electron transport complex subunit RsxG [Thiorhodovibrio frisius]|uniref:Ion-translocating oxidoreductase complex subunit G n=1 Tax=Thiorhodovibrio frisius TaxID=631362 RepID=H8Z3N7_9GAMM|nr:electron transport complex subunit RsxG [Thiorhodovibrio frisius]EIC20026.1 electron transport complex, RnfABCDGE type, G subunit [Thiorhodovibrio frisius]WPL20754.1 Nitrogen fixation protein RnfG [Thiorhodovibrio frisius]
MTAVLNPSYRQRIGYQAGLLGGFAMVAAALLTMGNIATHEAIAERHAEDLRASLTQVIPADLHNNDLLAATLELTGPDGTPRTVYRALQGLEVQAVAFRVSEPGYSGPIELMLGLDASGRILGVRVLSHTETPGLGDKIEVARDDWILAFNGLTLGDPPPERWAVKKDGGDFDQFSGATITPRAVVKAISGGLQWFADQRAALTTSAVIQQEQPHGNSN